MSNQKILTSFRLATPRLRLRLRFRSRFGVGGDEAGTARGVRAEVAQMQVFIALEGGGCGLQSCEFGEFVALHVFLIVEMEGRTVRRPEEI